MKQLLTTAMAGVFSAATLFTAASIADVAEGRWVTIDDADGSQASVVEIKITENGELQGTIVELLREDDKGKSCEECPDEFHNKPIEGLTFMWGLEKEGEGEWSSGRILDPESGSIYKSKLEVSDDGQTIEVRGYIGVSWIGRSQEWVRYQEPVASEVADSETTSVDTVADQGETL